jgi:hypothetical protein
MLEMAPAIRRMKTSAVIAATLSCAVAQAEESGGFTTSGFFVQAGVASETKTLVLGAVWGWGWQRRTSWGTFSGYWEASFGRWSSSKREADGSAWVTQLGLTPVLRLYPEHWAAGWFLEGGIGANLLLPVYQNADKSFSTTFNFGDHLGIGRRFGRDFKHEWVLRIQHFSNAGIKHPNPGEDFLQIRYSRHF